MAANISAKETTLIVDTDAGATNARTRIDYDGDGGPALVFQRKFGAGLWKGPLDLQQKAINDGQTPSEIAQAKTDGNFRSDALAPGEIIQYGLWPSFLDLEDLNPAKQEVVDGRFVDIVTIFALLKRSGEPNFIVDGNQDVGGTFRFRQVTTGTTGTVMVLKVGRGVPFLDNLGMWQLTEVERSIISPREQITNWRQLHFGRTTVCVNNTPEQ